jgi:hypothetical protein
LSWIKSQFTENAELKLDKIIRLRPLSKKDTEEVIDKEIDNLDYKKNALKSAFIMAGCCLGRFTPRERLDALQLFVPISLDSLVIQCELSVVLCEHVIFRILEGIACKTENEHLVSGLISVCCRYKCKIKNT